MMMSFCLSRCLFVCRLWNLLSHSLRGSTWQPEGAFRIDSDTLCCMTNGNHLSAKSCGRQLVRLVELRTYQWIDISGCVHFCQRTLCHRRVAYSRPRVRRSRPGRALNSQASSGPTTGGQQAVDTPVHRGPMGRRLEQSKSLINAINIT